MGKKVRLSSDKELVKLVKQGLKLKNGHCPCLIEVSEDTKCPCKDFREKLHCHCGMYIVEETKD